MSIVYGAIGGGRFKFLSVHVWLPNLSLLLASNSYRRKRIVSGMSEGISGEPSRLQAIISRAGKDFAVVAICARFANSSILLIVRIDIGTEGGEASKGSAAKAEDLGES